MTGDMDLRVDGGAWETISDLERVCSAALGAAAAQVGAGGDVDVLLTNDAAMQALNSRWRGKDKPTDVLSFPAGPASAPFLGDIALGFETVRRDADRDGKSLAQHISHLLVHGYLHLCGFTHEGEGDAAEMEALERQALATLGFPDPYSTAQPMTIPVARARR